MDTCRDIRLVQKTYNHIGTSISRQPLVKGERLMRHGRDAATTCGESAEIVSSSILYDRDYILLLTLPFSEKKNVSNTHQIAHLAERRREIHGFCPSPSQQTKDTVIFQRTSGKCAFSHRRDVHMDVGWFSLSVVSQAHFYIGPLCIT